MVQCRGFSSKGSGGDKTLNFISSSEFNAYLKQIKVILSAVKNIVFFSLVTNTILYFFTVANKGCSTI